MATDHRYQFEIAADIRLIDFRYPTTDKRRYELLKDWEAAKQWHADAAKLERGKAT